MEVEIRPYREPDKCAVVTLWKQVLADAAAHNDPETVITKKALVEDGLFFVAIVDDAVVGTVMGGYDGHRGWIYTVAVSPALRRRGIGTALVNRMETVLRELGCLKVNLQVRMRNREVVRFYEKLGFNVEEIISLGKRLYV
jgi:ribosomal protein S18 acetylase RimI-like enzyme